jgi:hypothetical protein
MPDPRSASGQASVELVALLPALVLLVALCWQALVAGQAVWLSGSAARRAARAEAVGADAKAAAAGALPARLREGLRVRTRDDGVEVVIRVPTIVGGAQLTTASARAHFPAQR